MKIYDEVKVVHDKEVYKKDGVYKGMVGYISMPEIRNNSFFVTFIDKNFDKHKNDYDWFRVHYHEIIDDVFCAIKIEDLELVKENNYDESELLRDLPNHNPKWWCKVENGYIMNLLGEKKNKIPYDYNS